MTNLDTLKTVIFPKGCLIGCEMQIMLATDLVPKLEAAGMTTPEWTRGAALLEEPHLSKVKDIVCQGCALTSCVHNTGFSPMVAGDRLLCGFCLTYPDREEFNRKVLEQILPADKAFELKERGLKVVRWMSSSRNRVDITIEIGEKSIWYSSNLRLSRVDFRVNNEEQPAPTSIASICDAVRNITDGIDTQS